MPGTTTQPPVGASTKAAAAPSRSENQPPAPGAVPIPSLHASLPPSSGGASLLRRRVVAHGLVARADLNEKTGVVTAWDGAKQRYTVFFDEISQPLAIKAANLTDVGPAVPAAVATSPGSCAAHLATLFPLRFVRALLH